MNEFKDLQNKLREIVKAGRVNEIAGVLSQSQDYIYENYDSLREEYKGYWISVYKNQVVGKDKNLHLLIESLRKKDIPLEYIALEDFSSEDIPIAL